MTTREKLAMARMTLNEMIEREERELNKLLKEREAQERNNCMACGKPITDWEDVEQKENEIIFTYRCSCGCYADQHYKLIYDYTEEIQ